MTAQRKRTYEEPWNVLKTTSSVVMRVVGSSDPKVVAKFAKTYRKALQKEKFRDETFRLKYPNAYMSSVVEGSDVKFKLHYNEYTALEVEEFECDASNNSNEGGMV